MFDQLVIPVEEQAAWEKSIGYVRPPASPLSQEGISYDEANRALNQKLLGMNKLWGR